MKRRNQERGFTLIEIIAVLVILGILAAVAVPKYLDMAEDARQKAAQAAIAEIKGRLATAQGKYILANGSAPTSQLLYNYAIGSDGYGSANNLIDVGNDYTVTVDGANAPIAISVTAVQNETLDTAVSDTFQAAGDS